MGAQLLGFAPWEPFGVYPGRHMFNLVMVIGPHLVCIKWLLPLLPWVGWSLLLLILLCPNQLVGYTALGAP